MIAAGRLAASVGAVALVTALYAEVLHVNPTTVAPTYLIVVLLVATGWGIAEGTLASLLAALCFNFFFLPPAGTFTIADPQNWIALLAFLLTAVVGSQLSGRARRRAVEALARQRDLERLYALSRALLLSERGASMPGEIARRIVDTFELQAVAVYDLRTDVAAWAGPPEWAGIDDALREMAKRGTVARDRPGLILLPIELGGAPIGSVAMIDIGLSGTVLQSIANLVAIGLERARADEATARAEAARQSSELRATVLDALAHEFKTPLTAMKAASSDLRASPWEGARDRELAAILDEEVDRLGALVTDAVQMLRIEAGDFVVHLERHQLATVIAATLRIFEHRRDEHRIEQSVPESLTVDADRSLLELALRQLLDNAIKYSPPSSTIEIRANEHQAVEIAVRNSGSVIPAGEQTRVVERFYRGARARQVPGTGMGLAIVQEIARAHGGTLAVSSSPESGTTFTLSLPRKGAAS
jgi:two-component system, OmpR family, sensor histidine kinase KdpD